MNVDPNFNQKTQQKTSKDNKNPQKSKKITCGQASGPCQASRRAKMAQKEVGDRTVELPWDPLGEAPPWGEITKKSKNLSSKFDEKSEEFKRASQSRFRPIWGGQKLQNEVKNDSEMTLGSEKTHFWKNA